MQCQTVLRLELLFCAGLAKWPAREFEAAELAMNAVPLRCDSPPRISQSRSTCVSAYSQAPGIRREDAPRPVFVPEEEKGNRTSRPQDLNAYIALVSACATESGYANRCRQRWRQPFFNQQTQGLFCVHPFLLQPRSRWFSRTLLRSSGQNCGHNELCHSV
jgi:hypothetical protein